MVWHGDQHKKTFLLVIDKDRKRRESTPPPDLRINGERLKTLDINDTCLYLGYWGTRNGDTSATREVVLEKVRVARDLIKSHPLTPELSAELFAQKGIGAFRFSAALIELSQIELEGLQKSGHKRIKTHATNHGQAQTLCTPSQLQRERDCFYYIIEQTYNVGLHSRRHSMEFDAGTRPFASFDVLSSWSRRRRERTVCVCVCIFTCVIFNIEYIVYICI